MADFMTFIRMILELLGLIGLTVGVIGGITYKLFQHFGENWLNAKFQERLEAFKHAQQKEIEHLRLKINTLLDRTIKLHQREFEVLPEAWAKLTDAFWKTLSFTSSFQEYPDLNKMTAPHLQEFLDSCQLGKWEKEEIKTQPDKTRYYIEHILWARLVDTRTIVNDAHSYIMKNGIFLPQDLKDKFVQLSGMIWNALAERQHSEQHKTLKSMSIDKQTLLHQKGEALMKELEEHVYHRLWSSQNEHQA